MSIESPIAERRIARCTCTTLALGDLGDHEADCPLGALGGEVYGLLRDDYDPGPDEGPQPESPGAHGDQRSSVLFR